MSPAPEYIVQQLLKEGHITAEQAELAKRVPMSEDLCVEADSVGHTDGGIPTVLFPAMLQLKRTMEQKWGYANPTCMGLAGGIGTPEAAAAAFIMGADFILTGSISQCTVDAGTSDDVKTLLQDLNVQDAEYAPVGDMFETGAKVQVLKKGVFFPTRANKLFSLYSHHASLGEIPEKTRKQLQATYFKKTFEEIWKDTRTYLEGLGLGLGHEIAKAEANLKHKMALVFQLYDAVGVHRQTRRTDQLPGPYRTGARRLQPVGQGHAARVLVEPPCRRNRQEAAGGNRGLSEPQPGTAVPAGSILSGV